MNGLKRKCPNCKRVVKYKSKTTLNRALKMSTYRRCRWCYRLHPTYIKNLSKSLRGRRLTEEWKEKLSKANIGHKDSPKTLLKKSKAMFGKNNPFYGKKHSEKTKKILRLKFRKRMEEKYGINGACPMYNIHACEIIEKYGKENGYSFQHALNGGEFYIQDIGYWVDGYDKNKNVVIEYYEHRHKRKNEVKRDLHRISEIKNTLKCKIIILREWNSDVEIIN